MSDALVPILIVTGVGGSIAWRKIDTAGGLVGGAIAYVLYRGVGWLGISLIGTFFVLGTLASLWKLRQKETLGVAEARHAQRGWRNVVANAGVASIIAGVSWMYPEYNALGELLAAAAFAAALSDTWSSELGNVYGRNFYHVLTGKRDQRGRDGVVSLVGSLAGVAGSSLIALLYAVFLGFDRNFWIVLLAGVVGNLVDSILGATWERRGWLGNHGVNFLNTLAAALTAYFLVKY